MKKKLSSKLWWLVGSVTLTIVGFIIVPPLITIVSNKVYKMMTSTDKIDFENLGPEIVKEDDGKGES